MKLVQERAEGGGGGVYHTPLHPKSVLKGLEVGKQWI